MRQISDYLNKITSEFRNQPNYISMLQMVLQPFADLQAFINSIPAQFDVDVAIGAQLDIVGQWVGISRNIPVPVQNVFFSFDDLNLALGWDRGIWKGPYSTPLGVVQLDDGDFRIVIKAKIQSNKWNGTISEANQILNDLFINFPNTYAFVEDLGQSPFPQNFFEFDNSSPLNGFDEGIWYQPGQYSASLAAIDMAMAIVVSGVIPSIVLLEVLAQNLISLKPVGVRSNVIVTSVNNTPCFGFDVDNQYIGGWDHGSWGVDPSILPNL